MLSDVSTDYLSDFFICDTLGIKVMERRAGSFGRLRNCNNTLVCTRGH